MAGHDAPAAVVHDYLVEHVAALDRALEDVGRHDPRGVHHARMECRRLRSALATFRPFVAGDTGPLREDLRWLGSVMGGERDRFVLHARLRLLVLDEPASLVADAVVRRLERAGGGSVEAPEELGSERLAALRDALRAVVTAPASAEAGEGTMRGRVRKDVERVQRRYDAVAAATDRDAALHDVRKAAKRLRYAAEAWEPIGGKDARRLRKAAKRLTSLLGERQDTVLTRGGLVLIADDALVAGEPTFTYGRLHAREECRAADLDEALPDAWRRFIGPATRSTC